MIWEKEAGDCGTPQAGYLKAVDFAGTRATEVQIAVAESGHPWTPDTAVFLYGSMSPDRCRVFVGPAAEIVEKVRPLMRPEMAQHVLEQQEAAMRLLTQGPGTRKRFVRWVVKGAYGDWYSHWMDPPPSA